MTFKFDDTKNFQANLESFLSEMETTDASLCAILRAKVSELTKLADETARRAARTRFNDSVKGMLEEKKPSSGQGTTE